VCDDLPTDCSTSATAQHISLVTTTCWVKALNCFNLLFWRTTKKFWLPLLCSTVVHSGNDSEHRIDVLSRIDCSYAHMYLSRAKTWERHTTDKKQANNNYCAEKLKQTDRQTNIQTVTVGHKPGLLAYWSTKALQDCWLSQTTWDVLAGLEKPSFFRKKSF